MKLRITKLMLQLLTETANHCRRSKSDIVRAAFVSYQRKADVVQISIPETCYRNGDTVISVRGCGQPDDAEAFKKHLAMRCLHELRKPKCPEKKSFFAPSQAPRTLSEALQMECYIDHGE
jgi:hypothetical protein